MRSVRVAKRYAAALMDVALERNVLEAVASDLELAQKMIASSRDLRLLLASPIVSRARKRAVFLELFSPHMTHETVSFLELLLAKHREEELAGIAEQFLVLRDEKLSLVTVEVTTAVVFPPEKIEELRIRLERHTGKRVRLHFAVDGAIKAGMVLRIGDTVLDGSVIGQLARLRERMIQGGPGEN